MSYLCRENFYFRTKMKTLFCVLTLCCLVASINAQTTYTYLRIPVGQDSVVFVTRHDTNLDCQCNSRTLGDCKYSVNNHYSIDPPFNASGPGLRIRPDSAESYSAFIDIRYTVALKSCDNIYCTYQQCANHQQSYMVGVTGFYDDAIRIIPYFVDAAKIRIPNSQVTIPFDTILQKHTKGSIPVEIFNNKAVGVSFTDWVMPFDSSNSFSLTVEQDSVPVSTVVVDSFNYITNLSLSFTTSLKSFASVDVFVTCHAHYDGKDSICTIPLHIYVDGIPESKVSSNNDISAHLDIYPNPSNGTTNVFCTTKSASTIHLHIFDELGKDIMTVYDGYIPEGKRNFSVKFLPGMYYARMETADGVVTKKLIIE